MGDGLSRSSREMRFYAAWLEDVPRRMLLLRDRLCEAFEGEFAASVSGLTLFFQFFYEGEKIMENGDTPSMTKRRSWPSNLSPRMETWIIKPPYLSRSRPERRG